MGVLLSVRAECEVGERHLVWAVVPAGALPRLVDALRVLRELVLAGAALDPARRVLRGPVEGRWDIPSDDQGRAVADGPGTDLLLEVAFAVPDPVDLLAGHVEPPTAVLHMEVADLVVVIAGAGADTEDGAAASGQRIEGQELLGQHGRIRTDRAEDDAAGEADPFGHRGRRRERGKGLEVRIDDAVDRAEHGEARLVGGAGEVGELLAGGSRHGVGQSDSNLHGVPFVDLQWVNG